MATGWSVLLTDYFPLAAVYDTALKRRLQISVGLKSHVLYKVFKIEVHKSCNLYRRVFSNLSSNLSNSAQFLPRIASNIIHIISF